MKILRKAMTTKQNKSLFSLVGIVILLLAVVFFAQIPKRLSQNGSKEDLNKPSAKPSIVEENPQIILAAFPKGFPLEGGVTTSASFRYVPAQSEENQSTLEYVSKKSLLENGRIFRDYLAKSDFKVVNKIEEPKLLFYYARREGDDLSIKIEEQNQKVLVSASYLK